MREALLQELIGRIYTAAHAPETWPAALDRIAEAYGATTALLWDFSAMRAHHSSGHFSASDLEEYWESWVARDPHVASFPDDLKNPPNWAQLRIVAAESGLIPTRPFRAQDAVPLEELRRSTIYADMLAPRDMVHQIVTAYFTPGRSNRPRIFNILRSEQSGPFEDDDLRSYAILSQHVLWALDLEQRGLEFSIATSRDGRDSGAVIVDRDGRILFQDQSAASLLDADDGLSLRSGRLHAGRRVEHDRLCQLIARCGDTNAARDSVSGGAISISRPSGRLAYEMIVTRPGTPILVSLPRAAALIWIRDPEIGLGIDQESLRQLFGLSAAEARVCAAFYESPTIPDVSRLLNISRNTVKTHMARIFEKVGVRSQSDLLKRLAQSLAVWDDEAG